MPSDVASSWAARCCASQDVGWRLRMLAPTLAPIGSQLQQAKSGRYEHCQGAREPRADGMVVGMATRKVTITLDEAQLDQIRSLVQARTAPSVSGFVQHAVSVALDDVAGWGAMLAEALRQTGGALSDDERAWADDVLGTSSRPAA
jgi:Arc/MetJ-type ribon-helix-helix transcriptional regulator